jgi:hypothetical protein
MTFWSDLQSNRTRVQRAIRRDERDSLRADMRDMPQNWDSELAALADEIAAIDRDYRHVKLVAEAMVERQSVSLH